MKNFIFKSTNADLQKMFQYIETKLEIQSSNILYLTHQTDRILKLLNGILVEKRLQTQVDDFYEETSPQTEQETPPEEVEHL